MERAVAAMQPALGEEQIVAGEQAMIEKIVRDNLTTLERDIKTVPRAQHPKHHGCVDAKFIVEPNLAANWRVGLFENPTTYDALIRFSNGRQTDDREPDIHGMAIKLLNVPGRKLLVGHENETTHDFLLIDHEVFFSAGMREYVRFNHDIAAAKRNELMKKLVKLHLLLLHPRLAIRVKNATAQTPASPLTTNYWSTTPYRLGGQAVKYMAGAPFEDQSGVTSKNGLGDALVVHLAGKEARFDFGVHVQTDPIRQPIEDPTVSWSKNGKLLPVKLATIVIPQQVVGSKAKLAENLAFSPWHALEAHRPLGAINRARRQVYEEMAKERHELNKVSPVGTSEVPNP
jgi:hypothetical protein